MTLRIKTLVIIGSTLVALFTVLYVASSRILREAFDQLEMQVVQHSARKTREIAVQSIMQSSANLRQWSWSDRTNRLMLREDSAALSGVAREVFKETGADFVVFRKYDGEILYGATSAQGRQHPLPSNLYRYFHHPAFVAQDNAMMEPGSSFVWVGDALICLYSRRVTQLSLTDDQAGKVIVGRYLTKQEITRLGHLSGTPMNMSHLSQNLMSPDVREVLKAPDLAEDLMIRPIDEESIGAYMVLLDDQRQPRTVIRWLVPRDIHRYGLISLHYIAITLAVLGLLFTGLTLLLLERMVLRRMKGLSDAVTTLSKRGQFGDRVPVLSHDELGALARNINEMLTALEISHSDILDREESLSRIVETNAEAILMVDLDGRITFANTAAEAMFGVPRAELCKTLYDDPRWRLKNLDNRITEQRAIRFWETVQDGAHVRCLEHTLHNADGRRLILSVNAAPLRDSEGLVTGCVASISDITERKMLEEQLAHQAFHDSLTGLPNRALFWDRLEKAHARYVRRKTPIAVFFLDLDNFKYVNDSLGHSAGDQLLIGVAQRIGKCLRECDTVARQGGDEFTILAEELTGEQDAMALATRVLEAMRQPFWIANSEVFVGVSIGISIVHLNTVRADELMRQADAALYKAKSQGKNRIAVYHVGMEEDASARMDLESDLRRALERDEMVVYYQPKIALETGRLIGMEALVRWRHPTRGLILPGEFIPLAEETGLIIPLGEWVLREACRQARRWSSQHSGADAWLMSVNISARQFQQADFAESVAAILHETGLDPQFLSLEITESIMMGDTDSTIRTLSILKGLGVILAIDDFGTGYSSLSYLRRFPMDIVKIDRSFIQGLGTNAQDSVIVSATISLAHALGLEVVAEGAETLEQAHELRSLGCDMAQGFIFQHPMGAEDVGVYLEDHPSPPPVPIV